MEMTFMPHLHFHPQSQTKNGSVTGGPEKLGTTATFFTSDQRAGLCEEALGAGQFVCCRSDGCQGGVDAAKRIADDGGSPEREGWGGLSNFTAKCKQYFRSDPEERGWWCSVMGNRHVGLCCRRVYQRAVVVPTSHVDQLWREYEQLENSGSNKTLGRRVLDEWRPKYQAGKLVLQVLHGQPLEAYLIQALLCGARFPQSDSRNWSVSGVTNSRAVPKSEASTSDAVAAG